MPAKAKPKTLYHYTSQLGLMGILTKGELWAGDIRYLNDSSEFTHALELAEDVLRETSLRDMPDEERALLVKLLNRTEREVDLKSTSEFAASLTEEGDLLSQWVSYCPGGGGYAIGFDTGKLESNVAQRFFAIVPCEYDRDVQEAKIEKIIDSTLSTFRKWFATSSKFADAAKGSNPLVSFLAAFGKKSVASVSGISFWSDLARIAPIFKHPSFEAEREWRVIPASKEQIVKWGLEHLVEDKEFHYESKPLIPDFREGRHSMVPYIPVSLIRDSEERPPVVEIVVGPTRYPDLAMSALQQYKEKLGYGEEVTLRATDATYRYM